MPFVSVAVGVYQVGGDELTEPGDCCVYLVGTGDEGSVLVDAGLSDDPRRLLSNIEETGLPAEGVEAVILTHCHIDHTGGVEAVRRRCGCAVIAHEGDADAIMEGDPVRTAAGMYGVTAPAIELDRVIVGDGGVLRFGDTRMVVVHSPGHTPGNISLRLEREGKVLLFVSDAHGPFHEDWGSDVAAWGRSVNRLIALAPDVLLEGHYGVIRPRASAVGFLQDMLTRGPQGV